MNYLLIVILFLLNIGCSSFHYNSERKIIGMNSPDRITPNYIINVKQVNIESINRTLSILGNVPDAYKKIVNDFGGIIVIFDGKLTANSNMVFLKGNAYYDNLPGAYNPLTKEAFIKQGYSIPCYNLELHEYGHMFYDAIHEPKEFLSIFNDSWRDNKFSMYFLDMGENPSEFFARSFEYFYSSNESRKTLSRYLPSVYNYFIELENRLESKIHHQ